MVSISLRSYINEINDMVDQRQIDEAIAHCRHILETFPKHVDTYRLLGKAYLEEQRYSDASDILQRVLSSVPEDFIAQVGMSIIREDEGNLDSAIYHMERAFETQPSNHAIQSELRRLHTLRDGIEMKRVRLTRGALARMYAHGNLYEQAISELHAALAEEPNRYDLQSLLAEMYYQTDKKVDAAETCTKILEKLPHCINANRLLTIILEESGRSEEAQRFRQRWSALDPYAAFVGTEYPTVEQVPDNKVSLDHHEWDPSEFYAKEGDQPGWAASLGVSLSEEERGDLPDWLNGGISSPQEQPEELGDEFPASDFRPTEMLPEDIASGESLEDDIHRVEGGRIDLMPQDAGEEEEEDWLSEFESKSPEIEAEDEEDWLASLEEEEAEAPAPSGFDPFAESADEQEEDWLGILDKPEAEPPSEEDLFEASVSDQDEDDWLSSLDASDEDSDPFAEPGEIDDEEEEQGEDEPDWLASLGPTAEQPQTEQDQEEELPDFLKEAGWETGSGDFDESAPIDYEEDEDQPLEQADIPDWIKDMAPPEDAFEEEDLEAEADPEWLKSLETPPSTETPDWLSEMGAEPQAEPTPPAEMPPSEPPQPETSQAPAAGAEIEPDEMDLAWLENLAAKRGIPDEELVTSAEQRASLTEEDRPEPEESEEAGIPAPSEEPSADSDWLQQIGQQPEEAETEQEPEEEPGEETATWLSSIAEDREVSPTPGVGDDTISRFLAAKDVLEPDQEPARIPSEETTADWLAELGEDDEEVELPEGGPISEEEDDIDTDWLRQIGRQAAQEAAESAEQPEEEIPSPVDEEGDDFDMDWLSEIGAQAAEEAAEEEAAPELPEEEEPVEEEKWLAPPTQSAPLPLDAEPEDYDDGWLTEVGEDVIEKADAPEPPGDPESDWLHASPTEITSAEPPDRTPVDEDADDFDMDWLTEIGEEALEEASGETLSPGELSEQDEQAAPGDLLPVDRAEADDLTMKWIEEVSEEAAQEAGEEASIVEPIEEIADEYNMDWLKEFAEEQEEEQEQTGPPQPVAGLPDDDELDEWLEDATQPSAAAADQADEDLDLDWLDELGAQEAEEAPPEPAQPAAAAPVDEDADDFDMDWLDQISEEAAEEAAGEPEEKDQPDASQSTALPVDVEPEDYADDWLTEAGEEVIEQAAAPEPPGEEEDWLSGPPTEPTPAPPPDLSPVDEEADDFDMDWLTQIGEEAIQEAAEEDLSPGEITESEEDQEEDWLAEPAQPRAAAPVDEEADDFDMDWLTQIGEEAAQEAAEEDLSPGELTESEEDQEEDWLAEPAQPGAAAPVEEEATEFDMDWHDEVSEEAPQEAAEEEPEDWLAETTPSEAVSPVDEDADDFNTAWLAEIGAEAAEEAAAGEQEPEEPAEEAQEPATTDDWLTQLEQEDEGSLERAISDTDAWLLSMEDTIPSGEKPAPEETEEPELEIEDTGDWLASLGIEQEEEEEEAGFEDQFDLAPELEQELPADEPPAAEIQPTQTEEWEPEPEAEAPYEAGLPPFTPPEEMVEPEPEPEPVQEQAPEPPKADTLEDQLDAARQAVSGGYIDEALASYGKLIKKGKLIDQVIKDLNDATMRHPINARLWQTLGDAYLRMDNLQDALDAYSKAEDLIR